MRYYSAVMRDNPQVYYRLSDPTGTTAIDSSAHGRNGTYSASGVTYGVPGVTFANTAVTFDGVAGLCSCPSGVDPSQYSQITIEYWFKLSTTNLPSFPAIVANDLVGATNKGIVTYINSDATDINFLLGNGTFATTCAGGLAMSTGIWYHFCAVWDGSNMFIYINANQVGGPTGFAGPIAAGADNVTLAHNPAGTDYFQATMDEFAIYSVALTADQIAQHYKARVPDAQRQYAIGRVQ